MNENKKNNQTREEKLRQEPIITLQNETKEWWFKIIFKKQIYFAHSLYKNLQETIDIP